MIEQETLLGFALNALPQAELEAVRAKLTDDTAAQMNLERILKVLQPLAVDRDEAVPPYDLVAATLGKLDASLATPKPRMRASRRWVEVALAVSIGLLGFGLVATGIIRFRADNARLACQSNLQQMAMGLTHYADAHDGKFPKVAQTAGDFANVLERAGRWPHGVAKTCNGTIPVGYAYSLGHRDAAGNHFGPERRGGFDSVLPLVADFPMKGEHRTRLISPHMSGSNILFQDGHVAYHMVPTVGHGGDHIYQNTNGEPKAGTHPHDTVLGLPDDAP